MPDPAHPIDYVSTPPNPVMRDAQPAPRSISGRKALLGVLGVAALLQLGLILFLLDVRNRKSDSPAPAAAAPAATQPQR